MTEAQDEIFNLTQHAATADQAEAGVVEPVYKAGIQSCLTFVGIPTAYDIKTRASSLAASARQSGCKKAMIGGAPYLMSALEAALIKVGVTPVYAYSDRVSVETRNTDGTVSKSTVFKHLGFVEVSLQHSGWDDC
jgi:hypothetical protein